MNYYYNIDVNAQKKLPILEMKKNMKVIYKGGGGQTDVSKTDHLNQILQFFSFCMKNHKKYCFWFYFLFEGILCFCT